MRSAIGSPRPSRGSSRRRGADLPARPRTEEDLIEEIVRVHGHDRLPSTATLPSRGGEQDTYRIRRRLREPSSGPACGLGFAHVRVRRGGRADRRRRARPHREPAVGRGAVPAHEPPAEAAGGREPEPPARASSAALSEVGTWFRLGDPVVEQRAWRSSSPGSPATTPFGGPSTSRTPRGSWRPAWTWTDDWVLEPGAERPFHPGRSGAAARRRPPRGLAGRAASGRRDPTRPRRPRRQSPSWTWPRWRSPTARSGLLPTCRGSPRCGATSRSCSPSRSRRGRARAVDAGGPLLDRATPTSSPRRDRGGSQEPGVLARVPRGRPHAHGPGGGADRRRDRGADALASARAAGLTVASRPGSPITLGRDAQLPQRRRPRGPGGDGGPRPATALKATPARTPLRSGRCSIALIFEKPSTGRASRSRSGSRSSALVRRPVLERAPAGPRDDRGHGRRAVPLRGRHRPANVRAGAARAARRPRRPRGGERAVGLRAPLPGARGPAHDPRAPRRSPAACSRTSGTGTTWRTRCCWPARRSG